MKKQLLIILVASRIVYPAYAADPDWTNSYDAWLAKWNLAYSITNQPAEDNSGYTDNIDWVNTSKGLSGSQIRDQNSYQADTHQQWIDNWTADPPYHRHYANGQLIFQGEPDPIPYSYEICGPDYADSDAYHAWTRTAFAEVSITPEGLSNWKYLWRIRAWLDDETGQGNVPPGNTTVANRPLDQNGNVFLDIWNNENQDITPIDPWECYIFGYLAMEKALVPEWGILFGGDLPPRDDGTGLGLSSGVYDNYFDLVCSTQVGQWAICNKVATVGVLFEAKVFEPDYMDTGWQWYQDVKGGTWYYNADTGEMKGGWDKEWTDFFGLEAPPVAGNDFLVADHSPDSDRRIYAFDAQV